MEFDWLSVESMVGWTGMLSMLDFLPCFFLTEHHFVDVIVRLELPESQIRVQSWGYFEVAVENWSNTKHLLHQKGTIEAFFHLECEEVSQFQAETTCQGRNIISWHWSCMMFHLWYPLEKKSHINSNPTCDPKSVRRSNPPGPTHACAPRIGKRLTSRWSFFLHHWSLVYLCRVFIWKEDKAENVEALRRQRKRRKKSWLSGNRLLSPVRKDWKGCGENRWEKQQISGHMILHSKFVFSLWNGRLLDVLGCHLGKKDNL